MQKFTPFFVFIICFMVVANIAIKAQSVGYNWVKTSGGLNAENTTDIVASKGNYIYACGTFYSATAQFGNETLTNSGSSDIFMVKYDTAGTVIWAKQMGGTGYDNAIAITTDSLDNIYVTGRCFSNASFGSISFTGTNFIVKIDNAGSIVWVMEPGSSGVSISDIAADPSGNIVICGGFSGACTIGGTALTSTVSSDGFVAKYNTSGSLMWLKQIYGVQPAGANMSTYSWVNESISSVAIAPNGAISLCGDTHGAQQLVITNGDGTGTDYTVNINLVRDEAFNYGNFGFIGQLGTNGNALWLKNNATGPLSGRYLSYNWDVATNADAELYVVYENRRKYTFGNEATYNTIISKFSNTGEELTSAGLSYYTIANGGGFANASIAVYDNKVYVANKEGYYNGMGVGTHGQEYRIICFNDALSFQWVSVYTNSNISINALAAKEKVYAGGSLSTNTFGNLTTIYSGGTDVFIAKLQNTITPELTFFQTIPDQTICLNDSTYLGADNLLSGGFPPYTYSWSPANTLNNATIANPLAKPTTSTVYIVTITDAGGMQLKDTVKINVLTTIPTPTITSNKPLHNCEGDTAVLTSSPAYTYKWSNGATTQSIKATQTGDYWVMIGLGGTCTSLPSAPTTFFFHPKPDIPTISQLGNILSSSATNDNQWYLNGSPIIGANSQTYSYNTAGTYNVRVINHAGCITKSTPYNAMLMVNNPLEENDSLFSFSQRITPNPATQQATIRYELNNLSTVSVYVVNNQREPIATLVNQQRQKAGVYTYPVNQNGKVLPKGNYYVVYVINGKRRVEPMLVL